VFGTTLGGPRLSSFASSKPTDVSKTDKPAKPFGAPDSDAEDGGDDDDEAEEAEEEDAEAVSKNEDEQEKAKEDAKSPSEDTKKPRLQRSKRLFLYCLYSSLTVLVVVDDGERDEATVLAVRAKMYQLDKELGWKERGAGMLKLNVPKASVEFDDAGTADIASFDASVLETGSDEDEAKSQQSVRLIMRQDHTLRLILNTTIVPAIKFQVITKLKSANVLFTAFDTDEVKQVQMKVSSPGLLLAFPVIV
jgi:Ran-binding protein 3